MRRSFLFLQGPCTPFFPQLADRLAAEGHAVHRVNFNMGDAVYWGRRPAVRYTGDVAHLHDFIDDQYRRLSITDQILFGDQRPVHRPAVERAKANGVRTHVFEEGYLRPRWITLERGGVNGCSSLPRDPAWFREVGQKLGDAEPEPTHSDFHIRAVHDVTYHVAGLLNPLLFPKYRTHAPAIASVEYVAYLRRFAKLKLIRAREIRRVQDLIASGKRFFFLPLQLNGDAQIRVHSPFANMGAALAEVMASFARHAPADTVLAIKNHPLDMGLMNFGQIIREYEHRLGLEGRVVYLEDGDLNALVRHAQGVVTVNSTVGMVALSFGKPTLALASAIYRIPHLTSEGGMDEFWNDPVPPDMKLFAHFRRVVIHATQVNGGFYSQHGIDLAVKNSALVLVAEHSPLEKLL